MTDWIRIDLDGVGEGESRGLTVKDEAGDEHALFAVRKGGRLHVYRNRCPHTGVNLEWMPNEFFDYERNYIQCAMHGALFAVEDGRCLRGPCLGQSLRKLPLSIRDDGCWVDLSA